MNLLRPPVTYMMKAGLRILCRIDAPGFDRIPKRGPLIIISNHTGSIEAPILYGELFPRPVSAWAKAESWDHWFLKWIFDLWEVIPVRRGEADTGALKKGLAALKRGAIFGMAPEGTRNKTGRLIRARAGVVVLALLSGAPILPVANWGGEDFRVNLKRLKRTDFHIRVGEPFRIETNGAKVTNEVRQEIADEMMYRLAALLPGAYRGEYANVDENRNRYLAPAAG
jgi:1-acyl-sn-glycerol-3-phosphate acyltransferase